MMEKCLRKSHVLICGVIVASVSVVSLVSAADWPQWRGTQRNGLSSETGLLPSWPETGPPLVWQASNSGNGYGAPAVANGRLYVTGNDGLENEFIKSFDAASGKELWTTRIGEVGNPRQRPNFPAARSTPTVDGEAIYVLGSNGDLACLEAATGKTRWSQNVRQQYGGVPGEWAYSESPLVDGERVICAPGGPDAALVALDKSTGDVVWKTQIPESKAAGYASVIVAQADGVKQYIAYLGMGLVGIDAESGRLLWHTAKTSGIANIATPVTKGSFVYSGASRTGGGLVEMVAADGGVSAEEVYFSPKLPTAIGGFVVVGDYLYGCNGQTMQCVEFKTGEVKWENRSAAPGSLCYADGRLYLHGENGEVLLIDATPEAYREVGRFTPPDRPQPANGMEKSWAYPVIANGKLFIRDKNMIWCLSVER